MDLTDEVILQKLESDYGKGALIKYYSAKIRENTAQAIRSFRANKVEEGVIFVAKTEELTVNLQKLTDKTNFPLDK